MAQTRNKPIRRSSNRFSEVPKAQISRSTFNRSHGHKLTFDAGLLYPIFVDDVLPGDTMTMNLNGFFRLATPLHPIMDNIYLDVHFFFVPNRLVWKDPAGGGSWEKFMGEQDNPGDSTDYTVPVISYPAGTPEGGIADYMGFPTGTGSQVSGSALPFRAYNLIYNTYYRDENLVNSVTVPMGDGTDPSGSYNLLKRGKRHDYFTSALPFAQKGNPVTIPIGDKALVRSDVGGGESITFLDVADNHQAMTPAIESPNIVDTIQPAAINYSEDRALYADLTTATATTINELRQAFQIQKLLERDARGGTRYTEIVKAHFNVVSSDARLNRPEILSTGTTPIVINPIAQTGAGVQTEGPLEATPQGNLAAVGTAAVQGMGFHKSFTEHGHIIGIISARADLTYQYGIERMWLRKTRHEHFFPALQHLGEQAILKNELYFETDGDQTVFGYQERFAEYRYKPSRLSGKFRSRAAGSLDTWHLAQKWDTAPVLNQTFIEEDPPIDRIIAVENEPQFIGDIWFNYKSARPMPVYGVPGLIDHF